MIDLILQNINSSFGNSEIIELGYMDVAMTHLGAEKMFWRIQFCHSCAISVPQIMIFKVDTQFFFYGLRACEKKSVN